MTHQNLVASHVGVIYMYIYSYVGIYKYTCVSISIAVAIAVSSPIAKNKVTWAPEADNEANHGLHCNAWSNYALNIAHVESIFFTRLNQKALVHRLEAIYNKRCAIGISMICQQSLGSLQ